MSPLEPKTYTVGPEKSNIVEIQDRDLIIEALKEGKIYLTVQDLHIKIKFS